MLGDGRFERVWKRKWRMLVKSWRGVGEQMVCSSWFVVFVEVDRG